MQHLIHRRYTVRSPFFGLCFDDNCFIILLLSKIIPFLSFQTYATVGDNRKTEKNDALVLWVFEKFSTKDKFLYV